MPKASLSFPEEIMLLALSRQTGAMKGGEWFEQLLAGAVVAEIFAEGRGEIVTEKKKDFLIVRDATPTGDELVDEWLQKIQASTRRRRLDDWLSRIAGTRRLKHRIAERLATRGILGLREDTVLWVFKLKRYPELDPKPEDAIRKRLANAIFQDGAKVDERTIVLLSILHRGSILKLIFGTKEIKARRKHVEALASHSKIGEATAKVIASMEVAMIAVIAASAAASAST